MRVPDADATLTAALDRHARESPHRAALTLLHPGGRRERLTTEELRREALAWGRTLERAGIGPGDLVLLVLQHSRALVTAFWGALYRGAMPCIFPFLSEKLDPALYVERVRLLVEHAGARAALTYREFAPRLAAILAGGSCRVIDVETLAHEPPAEATTAGWPRPAPDAVALLQYSSGTTGLQKGIALPHRSVRNQVAHYGEALGLRPDDVVVSWMPLYHDGGLIAGFVMPLTAGVPLVLMSPFHWVRAPRDLFQAVSEFRGTLTWMPNFAYNHCVRAVRDEDLAGVDLSSWRALVNAAEPVRLDSHRAFHERFAPWGFRESALQVAYGMAEATLFVTATEPGVPAPVDWVDRRRLAEEREAVPAEAGAPEALAMVSCGRPLRNAELRIVDERCRPLPERRVGQILIRCDSMFDGYHRQPELTARVMQDGWHLSGDMGYLAQGQLYVSGRLKDLIIVAGRNIYPQDLEAEANQVEGVHPGRTVAFGVSDPRLGTEVVVIVCELERPMSEPERERVKEEIRRRAWQQEVTLHDVRLVDERWLIKTSSGKISRASSREKYLRSGFLPE
jgi:acyl-CoA synthetase (AMP-forming)/AMP-acid ligase II